MKVIFLDIDGVLNSVGTMIIYPRKSMLIEDNIESRLCKIFNLILKADPSIKIVISSTWRIDFRGKLDQLQELLKNNGMTKVDVIGATPTLGDRRGKEIQYWLDNNTCENYCIIDDDCDMLESQMKHFVQTSPMDGITFRDLDKICGILNVPIIR